MYFVVLTIYKFADAFAYPISCQNYAVISEYP